MSWNRDITQAPLGKTAPVERLTKAADGNVKMTAIDTFAPDWLWLATDCGKVLKSHWIPGDDKRKGRWLNLATGEQPVAWQPYVIPAHPDTLTDEAKLRRSQALDELGALDGELI